jgi:hypothetical protein
MVEGCHVTSHLMTTHGRTTQSSNEAGCDGLAVFGCLADAQMRCYAWP